jgi:predicted dehydrogenase
VDAGTRDPVRVAVVGCGWWATTAHLPAVVADPRAELVAVVDSDTDRLQVAQAAFGNPTGYQDVSSMLSDVSPDAVVIATPPKFHYEAAELALSSGAHVLIEKPMVLAPADGEGLLWLAKRRGLSIVVGYPYHYNAQAAYIRSCVRQGVIGTFEFASVLFASIARSLYAGAPEDYREAFGYGMTGPLPTSYSDPAIAGGGQGQAQVTHSAALLLWLTSEEVESVSAVTNSAGLAVDLADAACVRFRSGAVATLAATGGVIETEPEMLEYRIFGSAGHIVWDVYGETGTIATRAGSLALQDHAPVGGYPMAAPVQNLIGLARGEGENQSPGELGLATVELLDCMYRSASSGAHVPVSAVRR